MSACMDENRLRNSRRVFSNQASIHQKFETTVRSHSSSEYLKPVSECAASAFVQADAAVQQSGAASIILDSGCGRGDGTISLPHTYPNCPVIGLDKSTIRLQKADKKEIPDNYPNPWPKKAHLGRRVYGHPVFVVLPRISSNIQVRSNWWIYLEEFSVAWCILTSNRFAVEKINPQHPISLFEKKFKESGHQLYRLRIRSRY